MSLAGFEGPPAEVYKTNMAAWLWFVKLSLRKPQDLYFLSSCGTKVKISDNNAWCHQTQHISSNTTYQLSHGGGGVMV